MRRVLDATVYYKEISCSDNGVIIFYSNGASNKNEREYMEKNSGLGYGATFLQSQFITYQFHIKAQVIC